MTTSGSPAKKAAKKASGKKAAASALTGGKKTRAATTRGSVVIAESAPSIFTPDATVARLVTVLGNNTLARILGVSPSQPTRWRGGQEAIKPVNRRRLSDLDHVLDRLLMELWPDQAGDWMTSPNAHLGGAAPIDVLVLRGAAPVLAAIDALATGAFV